MYEQEIVAALQQKIKNQQNEIDELNLRLSGVVLLSLPLAEQVHEYLILLRQAVYASGDIYRNAIKRLDGYGTPMVEFEKALGKEA